MEGKDMTTRAGLISYQVEVLCRKLYNVVG